MSRTSILHLCLLTVLCFVVAQVRFAQPSQAQQGWEAVTGEWTGVAGETGTVSGAMEELGATVQGDEIVVDLPSDILFDFDKSDIRPDAAATLGMLLTIIEAQPSEGPVRIEGHTDAKGSDAYNQALSERRAKSVRQWLSSRGVENQRMVIVGFGERRPVAPNTKPDGSDDPEGRQQNRRVQVFIRQG